MMKTDTKQPHDCGKAAPRNFLRRVSDCPLPSQADLDIALTAKKILRWLTVIPADTIRVTVDNGWITLSGEVEYAHQQAAAALTLHNLAGVIGIFNHIQVQPRVSSDTIKAGIESALHNNVLDDMRKINVSVEGTDVTLSGEIDSWTERSMANHFAWEMPGVRHVADHMTMSF